MARVAMGAPIERANGPIEPGAAPVGIDEAKTWLRLEACDDDGLVAALIRSATEMCEAFIGQLLIARGCQSVLVATGEWQKLGPTPVRAITSVEGLPADGAAFVLPSDGVTIDIDCNGDGWVRVTRPGAAGRIRISYRAGLAEEANGVPEALRHGVLRLVAHLYATRDDAGERAPPAAVTALWRPWRRMRL